MHDFDMACTLTKYYTQTHTHRHKMNTCVHTHAYTHTHTHMCHRQCMSHTYIFIHCDYRRFQHIFLFVFIVCVFNFWTLTLWCTGVWCKVTTLHWIEITCFCKSLFLFFNSSILDNKFWILFCNDSTSSSCCCFNDNISSFNSLISSGLWNK